MINSFKELRWCREKEFESLALGITLWSSSATNSLEVFG
jgi:hypothetical protein